MSHYLNDDDVDGRDVNAMDVTEMDFKNSKIGKGFKPGKRKKNSAKRSETITSLMFSKRNIECFKFAEQIATKHA